MDSEFKKGPKRIEISSSSVSVVKIILRSLCHNNNVLLFFVVSCLKSRITAQAKSSAKSENRWRKDHQKSTSKKGYISKAKHWCGN